MKINIVCPLIICIFICTGTSDAQRSTVVALVNHVIELASDVSLYSRRAYNSTNFEDLQVYAHKAKITAEEAEEYGCEDAANYLREAESYFSDVTTYARRAYNADLFEDAIYYAHRAKRSADDAETNASNASNECEE
jgi:hypothetical protein